MKNKNIIYTCKILFVFLLFLKLSQNSRAADETIPCKIRLPEIINSHRPTILPVLSPNGRRLYFDRKFFIDNIGSHNDPDDIWYSERKFGYWTEPQNAELPLNSRGSDVLFSISPDGEQALLYGKYGDRDSVGFAIAQWNGLRWSKPQLLKFESYTNLNFSFYGNLSSHRTVLMLAIEDNDSFGDLDVYVSFYNEQTKRWSAPKNLGEQINSSALELSPYLASDGKTLYFASNRDGGFGDDDIYVSRRLDDSWTKWSTPVNLGSHINTKRSENSISLTSTGDTACVVSSDDVDDIPGLYFVCLPENLQPLKERYEPTVIPEIITASIYFAANEFAISPQEKKALEALAGKLILETGEIFVEGYADDAGGDDYNIILSQKRAKSVAELLKTMGIKAEFRTRGYGKSKITAPLIGELEKAKERRVDIVVRNKKE